MLLEVDTVLLLDPKISFRGTFHTFSLIDFLNGCICSKVVISATQNLILCNKTTFWTIMKMCIIIMHNFIAGQLFLLFYFLLALSNWAKCLETYSKKNQVGQDFTQACFTFLRKMPWKACEKNFSLAKLGRWMRY